MSSAGFTGRAHLLSSERSDTITGPGRKVKDFFRGAPSQKKNSAAMISSSSLSPLSR